MVPETGLTPESSPVDGRGLSTFWSLPPENVLRRLGCSKQGLTSDDARRRLALQGADVFRRRDRHGRLSLLASQFKSPIILFLVAAAGLSASLGQHADALTILAIVLGSGLLGFWQERGADEAVAALLARVEIKAAVIRDGSEVEIPAGEVVPGDLGVLNAGDIIPADCLVLESKDLHLDEAALTGETYPVEKAPGPLPAATALGRRSNCLFLGTHAVSSTAAALAVGTGSRTGFGRVSGRLGRGRPEAEFERVVRRFGYLLMEVTFVLVLVIFAVNVALGRPALEALLFSTALGVGLTPQLLPVIIGVNLAHGAREMAGRALGFRALPAGFLLAMGVIVASYIAAAELVKRAFFGRSGTLAP